MKNKKGALVQTILISIIILIISATIIFYFFRYLPYKGMINKEACHQSVLLRSQSIAGLKPGQQIPLNCKTEEVIIKSTNEEAIKREIANKMYDCWWMLGEGKKNFFGRGLTKNVYCVLCSRIKFDENVQEQIKEIKDFDSYLENTKIPQKDQTYFEYFTSGTVLERVKKNPTIIDTSKEYLINYALIERNTAPEKITGVTLAVVGAYFGFQAGGIKGASILAIGGYIAGSQGAKQIHNWVSKTKSDYYVAFGLIPSNAEEIKNFGCERLESIP